MNHGISIFFPHDLRENVNIISIPFSPIFSPYLEVMRLYAKVYARSIYKFDCLDVAIAWQDDYDDYIIGVDSLKQLKENYELFGNKNEVYNSKA